MIAEYARLWHEVVGDPPPTKIDNLLSFCFSSLDNLHRNEYLASSLYRQCRRFGEFVHQHGVMMLCIMAYSMAFREATCSLNDRDWATLEDTIVENSDSLEIFAKSRDLDWTAALEYAGNHPKSRLTQVALKEKWPWYLNHPYQVVIPNIGQQSLRLPRSEGYIRSSLTETMYREESFIGTDRHRDWPAGKTYPSDPTLKGDNEDNCELCKDRSCLCHPCTSTSVVHPLVELRQYHGKGIGVRTLQNIRRREILEEYVGLIVPIADEQDSVYSVLFRRPEALSDAGIAQISAKRYGNWTRFINHSCSASLGFRVMAIGEKYRVMVIAEQDIDAFSELTIDYGPDYWLTPVPGEVEKFCLCGLPKCRYSNPERKNLLRQRMAKADK